MDHHRHFILHKPFGTISQFVNPHKRKKKLLGEFFKFPEKTMMLLNIVPANDGRGHLSRVVPSLLIPSMAIAGE